MVQTVLAAKMHVGNAGGPRGCDYRDRVQVLDWLVPAREGEDECVSGPSLQDAPSEGAAEDFRGRFFFFFIIFFKTLFI